MVSLEHGAVCRLCREGYLVRRRRPWWMRLIPGSRQFQCNQCHSWFVVQWGRTKTYPEHNPLVNPAQLHR
jgi:hypothetical protein